MAQNDHAIVSYIELMSFESSTPQDEATIQEMDQAAKCPRLLASTGDTYSCTIAESRIRESNPEDGTADIGPGVARPEREEDLEANYFKSAQWTPDGTSLLTASADNTIRTFILPPTLLDSASPQTLTPYTTHALPTPINCLTPYPYFALSDSSTTLYLCTPSALPIRLLNALNPLSTPVATYNLISPNTEAYYTPSSLLWSSQNHFLAGTDCLIALFDISRSGQGPVTRLPTIPSKRHKMKGGGVGMRGIVSAMSQQPSPDNADVGMLAAGTWTRWVGLYDVGGLGGTVATWSIAEAADVDAGIGGTGVTETRWSACGRYMFVVERRSKGVLVFDVRVTGKLVSWLVGRDADTNQRIGIDLFPGDNGTEVWAGGVDGVVKVWEGVGMTEGSQERSWEWKAHDDPVSSTMVHSSGTVVATSSGHRSSPGFESSIQGSEDSSDDSSDSESDDEGSVSTRSLSPNFRTPDNSIKVWSL
ncbi:related to guanine nucleotide-binding protein [Rhynchosporium agropyri]|uniref:Related to guanine nucleotide-binding protein n=1 Tax=Rhynchosporium agropyri TaxID=914238 RepID=A0A1E1JUB9_9HELO|nr:related to guanine nucleotide-binding protein [Rhynchosporium agropyri]